MRTQYPNNQTESMYTRVLLLHYKNKYPDFTSKQIEVPLKRMHDFVSYAIREYQKPVNQLVIIDLLLQMLNGSSKSPNRLEDTFFIIGVHLKGEKKVLNYQLKKLCKVELPEENVQVYYSFISELTTKILKDLCDATKEQILLEQQKLSDENQKINQTGCKQDDCVKASGKVRFSS